MMNNPITRCPYDMDRKNENRPRSGAIRNYQ